MTDATTPARKRHELYAENERLRAEIEGLKEIQGFLEAETERLHERIQELTDGVVC
jgi:predicted nuclease with TOPRIM domain